MLKPLMVIACGALAREIKTLKQVNAWEFMHLHYLDADLHNHPEQIPARLQAAIQQYKAHYEQIFVAYADCGTGGGIDRVLVQEKVERLAGAHCYAFYAGQAKFAELVEQELGSFYLTDFLARHFERLVIQGFKLDRYPVLKDELFRHYQRVVYLSQTEDPQILQLAQQAATYLGLAFEHVHCGYGELASTLQQLVQRHYDRESHHLLA
ncbi:DUF1638 domain-containing protein [Thiolinea disciformis]|uniref:DUF1638 domain-containing protein n=1 Tax=Thiolinea disciformis TaxID=125614 RepID=UPI000381F17F|nr:DUF1638 domain-containing protein [Thiolinea disciformis]